MKTNIMKKVCKGAFYMLLAPALFAVSSCSSMLETDSELVEFEKDNTLNHPTDSVYSVLGIISKLQVIADRGVILGEARGDLVKTTVAASADLKDIASFKVQTENKYNEVSDYYAVINNCNYFITHVDTLLERRGRRIFENEYAAVKAFRAWTYLQMVQIYGEVPLVITPVMTEIEAKEAMLQPRMGITDICNYFISDLTPYAERKVPNYGTIDSRDSRMFFIPMKPLLGDLCLWAGRYQEAAQWYHSYLADRDNPVRTSTTRSSWYNTEFQLSFPSLIMNVNSSDEMISYIPMETKVFDGTISDLPNIFTSTRHNNYYYQLTPSTAMFNLSKQQTYCYLDKRATITDTLYVTKQGLQKDVYAGDLRLASAYSETSVNQDAFSEYSSLRQTIGKVSSNLVKTYRKTVIYLRYAEALNRCGLPQSAMAVLKYGLYPDNVKLYVDSLEQAKAGNLITFDANQFTEYNTQGIHSRGSGSSEANAYYTMPMPETALATREDTINYQITHVEDLIINEMALETAFEGYRYFDLMRVALRRDDPSYLATPVSRRSGTEDATIKSLLMDKKNWFLPLPN